MLERPSDQQNCQFRNVQRFNWTSLHHYCCAYYYYTVSQNICPPFHPQMPIGKVWIYRLLFVFVCACAFVRLRISPARIKLACKILHSGVYRRPGQGICHFGKLCSPQTQSRTNRPATVKFRVWRPIAKSRCRCAVRKISCGAWT